jgi:DNA-binding XRE family transcriptional regulator
MTDPVGVADLQSDEPGKDEPGKDEPGKVVPLAQRRPAEPLLRDLIGGVIRRARHDQQRTLADVAGDAGVSVPYLSEIERGRKEPSSEMLAAVCRALDLDLLDLVSRTYVDLVEQRYQVSSQVSRAVPSSGGRSGDVLALAA